MTGGYRGNHAGSYKRPPIDGFSLFVLIALGLALVVLSLQTMCSPARAGSDLTADEVRTLLASAGVNPGTARDLGNRGRKAIQKITVRVGHGREHYVIDLWLASPGRTE